MLVTTAQKKKHSTILKINAYTRGTRMPLTERMPEINNSIYNRLCALHIAPNRRTCGKPLFITYNNSPAIDI